MDTETIQIAAIILNLKSLCNDTLADALLSLNRKQRISKDRQTYTDLLNTDLITEDGIAKDHVLMDATVSIEINKRVQMGTGILTFHYRYLSVPMNGHLNGYCVN